MTKNKVGIVSDSIGCIPREMVEKYGIEIVSPNIYFNGSVYQDLSLIHISEPTRPY